jgi:hypothetical protein
MAASSGSTKALDLFHQAMHAVLYWRTTAAIKNGQSLFLLLLPW